MAKISRRERERRALHGTRRDTRKILAALTGGNAASTIGLVDDSGHQIRHHQKILTRRQQFRAPI